MQTADDSGAAALEAALDVQFDDPSVLLTALTHSSHLNEVSEPDTEDNERLEFLGDALVDFVAGEYLFRRLPEAQEGDLTALRAALVCESALAGYARQLDLGRYLRLGRGEEASGGRARPAILCNAFEALVGALYLDRGLPVTEAFVLGFFEPELASVLDQQRIKDSKSMFQELAQRTWQITPNYRTLAESGPDHDKRFVVAVSVMDEVWGVGEGRSKAVAAREAAGDALDRFSSNHQPDLDA